MLSDHLYLIMANKQFCHACSEKLITE